METENGESEGLELNQLRSKMQDSENIEDHLDGDEDDHRSDDMDSDHVSVMVWVPSGRGLITGFLGLNVVLLGAALVAGDAFNPSGLQHQEPEVWLLLLMGLSVVWMLWYLLWARKQPGLRPHTDHHAGGVTVTVVLMLFAGFSLLLCVFMMVHNILMKDCQPLAKVIVPFFQTPFLALQTYLLWAHSKDCIHKHRILTRSGLMLILCTDILLWLSAVTEDSIHMQIEMEKQFNKTIAQPQLDDEEDDDNNATECHCGQQPACAALRKGYEILYPFNMEFSLLAGCMLYVMWKNVGRHTGSDDSGQRQKVTLRIMRCRGMLLGPVLGLLVLVSGSAVFPLYQVWVGQTDRRVQAFLIFYSFHVSVMPLMVLCSLVGTVIYRQKEWLNPKGQGQAEDGGTTKNHARRLDVLLLVGSGLGQLSLSYFSLVAALALGPQSILEALDLSYSLLSLLELVVQNIFIIEGLQEHKHTPSHAHSRPDRAGETLDKVLDTPPTGTKGKNTHSWSKRFIREICAFLLFSNIMLWVIPAFGAHPQFESGVGKQFFGFSVWFVLVNLGQPLTVFYRMHSVGALMELLITA
ncbi:proton channel OTOP3-like [Hoplias malabaricus]|uniref:proton channel OTOP3-like n=1 Tax=Hoplias malabaricus TaxID=27720 RepID=UPI003463005F